MERNVPLQRRTKNMNVDNFPTVSEVIVSTFLKTLLTSNVSDN